MLVLLTLGALVVAAALAVLPIVLARSRRHRHVEIIAAIAVLWGFLAAGSVVMTSMEEAKWSKERLVRVQSGYYDPNDNSGAPAKPVGVWTGLAVSYVALILWSLASRLKGDRVTRGDLRQEE